MPTRRVCRMSTNNLPFELPADFESRCTSMFGRLQAGEPMTVEYLADQLGLPYGFLATALAVYCAVTHRVPVLVDYGPAHSLN